MATLRDYALEIAFAAAVLGLANALFGQSDAPDARSAREPDRTVCQQLISERPELFLLGNSILRQGVDARALSRSLRRGVYKFERGGSASAFWYVFTKNVLASCPYKPPTLVLFFRDYDLTNPRYRVTKRYKSGIDQYSGPSEPVLDRLAYARAADPVETGLGWLFPAFRNRARWQEEPSRLVKTAVSAIAGDGGPAGVDQALDRVFAERNLNPILWNRAQLEAERTDPKTAGSVDEIPGDTFLPHMVEITRQAGIRLVMVRTKSRRDVTPGRQPKALRNYIRRLSAYLKRERVGFLDFSRQRGITEAHYGSGDHFNQRGKAVFTRMLAEKLRRYVRKQEKASP